MDRRLYKSNTNKMIAGVCGGIGEYFNIDPVVVRLAVVLLALLGLTSGFWLYLIACLVIPRRPYY